MSNRLAAMANIADDAIEQVRYGQEHARWLAALMSAIHKELEPGPAMLEYRARRVQDLASLGQYLADDLANYMDCRASELQEKVVAVGGAQ